ncbi:MAG: M20/M25/M40 family metallo-hydrolase [Armatimonadota bacterium]|jgi:glutaminyl-peptide cyclotransferase
MRLLATICIYAVLGASCSSGGNGTPPVDPPPTAPQRPAFDAERAFADLEAQVAFGPRIPGSEAHQDCLQFLIERLEDAGAQVVTQQFSARTALGGDEQYDFTNVAGLFAGDARGDVLLLGAHWDSRAKADEDPDPALRDQPVPGANDGASGVAVLLEIARAFTETAPRRPVILAFFDAEDQGASGSDLRDGGWIIGSRQMAENWPRELPWPDEMILVDLVGGDGEHNPAVGVPPMAVERFSLLMEGNSLHSAPNLVDRIWTIAEERGHEAFERRQGRYVIDDHVPFIERGVPSIDIIHFVPPEWHTTHDTPENCSPDSLHQVGDTLLEYIYAE